VECNIPDIYSKWQCSALGFAARAAKLPDEHPTKELFQSLYADPFSSYRTPAKPLTSAIKAIEDEWKVDHNSLNRTKLKVLLKQSTFDRWSECKEGKALKSVKSSPELSHYLRFDSKSDAVKRARLRFDRARLNYSLHRRTLIDSPSCATCAGINETRDHLIADCPRYDAARYTCRLALEAIGVTFDVRTVLGSVDRLATSNCQMSSTSLLNSSIRFGQCVIFKCWLQPSRSGSCCNRAFPC
jgi:hypothetical protein